MSVAVSIVPERYLPQLERVLRHKLGHSLPVRRLQQIADSVSSLAVSSGYADVEDYLDVIARLPVHAPLAQALIKTVTNKESYFFRDAPAIEALRSDLLPALIDKNRATRVLRIWSAGCSTGEEVYTLSILLQELLTDYERWTVSLVATDVDGDAMAIARRAEYKNWSLRSTPQQERHRYFHYDPARNVYQLRSKYRQNVSFGLHNLIDTNQAVPAPGAFDLILCRNVSIYFDGPGQVALAQKFHKALAPGGVWVSGPSDPRPAGNFETTVQSGLISHRVPEAKAPERRPVLDSVFPEENSSVLTISPEARSFDTSRHVPLLELEESSWGASASSLLEQVCDDGEAPPDSAITAMVPSGELSELENQLYKARALADAGSLFEARTLLDSLVVSDPMQAQVYLLRAMVFQALGQTGQAIAELKRTIYLDPSEPEAHLRLGFLLREQGDNEGALRAFRTTGLLLSSIEEPSPEQVALREAAAGQLVRLLREAQG